MATKNVSIVLSANTGYTVAESTATITGRTVYGRVVTIVETINQAAVAGSISVTRTGDFHLDGAAGTAPFTVSWTGLTPGSTITLSGSTGISGLSNITNIQGSGSATVNASYSSLSSNSRLLTLTATGTDGNGNTQTDNDSYRQYGASGTSGSTMSVSAVTSSPVGANATSVTFKVTYKNIWGTINLIPDPSTATTSPTSITANGSGSTNVTVTMGANSSHDSRDIVLSASTAFNSLTRSASITQNGEGYNPDIWWTKTSDGSTKVTSVSDVPAYVSGTYDGRNVTYTIYINYNNEVDTRTITLDASSLTGATASRSGKTITITAPVNEATTAKSLGSITVNATAPDGNNASATLSVTQVAGVSPVFTISPATQNIAADGTSASAQLTYDYVGNIASGSTTGNITSVSLSN